MMGIIPPVEVVHYINGPSALSRRMVCAGSMEAERGLPSTTSKAAEAGTQAHAVLERWLLGNAPTLADDPKEYINAARVAVDYVEPFREQGYELFVEVQVDPGRIFNNSECAGTADIILIKDRRLIIVDFKYGVFPVSAERNYQLMAYAAGAVCNIPTAENVEEITMAIIQPNSRNGKAISSTDLSRTEIEVEWQRIKEGLNGDAATKHFTLTPGDHCVFCKAKRHCSARLDLLNRTSTEAFKMSEIAENLNAANTVSMLPELELAKLLDKIPLLESIISDVKEETLSRALKGSHIPGYKVVEGAGRRNWIVTESELRKKFRGMALSKADFEVVKIGSPAAIEKIGKITSRQKENLSHLWEKSKGKPKLVVETAPGIELVFDSGEAFTAIEEPAKAPAAPAKLPPSFI